jgi:hypothetical protein
MANRVFDREIAPSLDRGSDRGQPMRILSISLLVFASSASAQSSSSVDCNAIKNSIVPVELAYHSQDGTRTVVQAYRDKSGDYVVWSRQTLPSTHPNPPVFVTKATYVDGAIASAEFSTTYVGKYSHRTAKYTPDGLPKNFDHRSDVTYKMHAVITSGDDTTEERTSTISYKFKSEETTAVGPCVLQVIHGESDTTNDAARTRHRYQLYFPELRISATEVDAEPIMDSLSTVFSEIKQVN